jgi:DNA-directed RNA polymerase specialized sigma24 family protein
MEAQMDRSVPAATEGGVQQTIDAGPPDFESFFRAEHARLFRAMYLVTRNSHDAEELMQDAFLNVWERWDRVGRMDLRKAEDG